MKIVDVSAFYSPAGGGVRTYVHQKLAVGPRLGHEIVVLVPGERHIVEDRGPGARIIHLPSPRFPLDRRYRYFADDGSVERALDSLQPDLVEASSPWRSAETVANWAGSVPRALIMHADPLASYAYRWFGMVAPRAWIDRRFEWFWRHLLRLDRQFDAVIAANQSLSQRLRDGGLQRVSTEPMGVAPNLFSADLRDDRLRARMLAGCGLGPEAALLVAVGRLSPEKRWPMVIDACVAAGRQRPIGLVLIGDGRDKARLLRHIGGNPHIRIIEPLADRLAFARTLASGDALIHGCESETFCMVAAEAVASGIPIIVPDQGGAADLRPGTGITYSASSASAAAAAIDRVLRSGGSPLQAVQPCAMRTMDDHFRDLFARYQNLVRSKAA